MMVSSEGKGKGAKMLMKAKLNKACIVVLLLCVVLIAVVGCEGRLDKSVVTTNGEVQTSAGGEMSTMDALYSTSTTESLAATTERELEYVDVFADVIVTFEGWNNFGRPCEILTDNCDEFITENVIFSFSTEYNDLWNGSTVSVVAEYDSDAFLKEGLIVTSDAMQYTVEGLREIITAQDFYDGVAWVEVREQGVEQWCCCDNQ